MNRRTFLGTLTGTAASLAVMADDPNASARGAATRPAAAAAAAAGAGELPAPPPGVEYFSEERLTGALEKHQLKPAPAEIGAQAICYTFNPWHPSPFMEKTFGKGWTEWETMRHAKPMFEGHYQPKRPLWGTFNEADPAWAAREIELAAAAGITAFMIDWYWHEGTMFYHEQLEQGLLKAPNRERIQFAVMWANHHWPNVYPAPESGKEAVLLPQAYSDADMQRMGEYLLAHYFMQPNYLKIDGKAVFAIFWSKHLIEHFGPEKLRGIFEGWSKMAQKAGLAGVHIQASDQYDAKTPLVEAGFSSCTRYHTFAGALKEQVAPFAQAAEFSIARWEEGKGLKLPYFPQCPVGWDNSPRYGHRAKIVTNRTADQYERMLRAGKAYVGTYGVNPKLVYIGAWNEWTEDHYLLPDEVHGYGYLEAVKRVFGR